MRDWVSNTKRKEEPFTIIYHITIQHIRLRRARVCGLGCSFVVPDGDSDAGVRDARKPLVAEKEVS